MKKNKIIFIVGIVVILAILSLFIPAIKQKKDLTSSENDRENVLYEGNTEDSKTNEDTTSADQSRSQGAEN